VLVIGIQPYSPDLKIGEKVVVKGQAQEARVSRICTSGCEVDWSMRR
jgi:hypothetical protein